MSLSVVAVVWCLHSVVVAVTFWFCLLQPYWFIHDVTMTSLGVYSYCYHGDNDVVAPPGDRRTSLHEETPELAMTESCHVYGGGRFHFSKLPSTFWQASCILFGSASVLASLCGLISLVTVLCLPRSRDHKVAAVTGYVQIIAG